MTHRRAPVTLVAVDDDVLDALVEVATTRASADEVTPPLTPGPRWTPPRVAWLRAYHRDRRRGLDGPAAEATWAVLVEDRPVGSVRLQRTDRTGVLEAGVWLARDARGRGLGTAVLAAVLQQAADLGATAVRAETTARNAGATGVLRALGFTLDHGRDGAVRAVRPLDDARRGPPGPGRRDGRLR